MRPYDDLRGHYRDQPAATVVTVAMDVTAVVLPVAAIGGVVARQPVGLWFAVAGGTAFVAWATVLWTLVAEWRGWE